MAGSGVNRIGESDRISFISNFRRKVDAQVRALSNSTPTEATVIEAVRTFESLERQVHRVRGRLLENDHCDLLLQHIIDLLFQARSQLGMARTSTAIRSGKVRPAYGRGAAKYAISCEQLAFFVRLNMTAGIMAEALVVSESTIRRRLRDFNMPLRSKYATLTNDTLDEIVEVAMTGNRLVGARAIKARLQGAGVFVQREKVRESVCRVDPVGVALRALRPQLERAVYSVASPNSLWHIDGNHKLIRWGIVIHGGVDGASRMLVFLSAADNNRASTVLERFIGAVTEYGFPSRVRMDHGVENNDVSAFIQVLRGPDSNSVIYGKSVHNQRIERAWVDVWKSVTNVYYSVFYFLEYRGYLDINSNLDLWLLHYVYLPRINDDIKMFVDQWNCHGLSTEKGRSPEQLFVLGILKNANSQLTAVRDIFDRNGVPIIDESIVTPDVGFHILGKSRVLVQPPDCPLTSAEKQQLELEIVPLTPAKDHGMSIYLAAKRLITELRS